MLLADQVMIIVLQAVDLVVTRGAVAHLGRLVLCRPLKSERPAGLCALEVTRTNRIPQEEGPPWWRAQKGEI